MIKFSFLKRALFHFSLLLATISAQEKENLSSLINEAIHVSPKLEMLNSKKEIAKSIIPQVSNLPDPSLTFGLNNLPTNSFSFTQEPMTGKVVGLSQGLPFPGKLSAAADVKGQDTLIVQKEIDDYKNEISKSVTKLYYDLSYIRASLEISKKSKELLKDISKVVKAKYAVSTAQQQNLIKIDLEITRINDKIEGLKGKESSDLASINSFLLRKSDSPISTTKLDSINYKKFNNEELVKISEENRPYLRGIQLQKEKAKLMENLADYDFYPNFNFKLQYSQRDYISKSSANLNDLVSVFVGMNLPLNYGGKTTAKVEEAKLKQKLFDNKYETAKQFLSIKFGELTANLNELYEREKLTTEGLLPQAEQSLKAALASYKVGDVDFLNVIDAQNKLYKIEDMLYSLRANYNKQFAELEFLTGKNLKEN